MLYTHTHFLPSHSTFTDEFADQFGMNTTKHKGLTGPGLFANSQVAKLPVVSNQYTGKQYCLTSPGVASVSDPYGPLAGYEGGDLPS